MAPSVSKALSKLTIVQKATKDITFNTTPKINALVGLTLLPATGLDLVRDMTVSMSLSMKLFIALAPAEAKAPATNTVAIRCICGKPCSAIIIPVRAESSSNKMINGLDNSK